MTDLQNKWLTWWDSWKGCCPECGLDAKHLMVMDTRGRDIRYMLVGCDCGWERTYTMAAK